MCCFCDKLKFKAKINIVNIIDMWCHSIARLSKTGYSVVCISQFYNYLYGCFSGEDLFLLEEYFSSCDICDRPELGRTPEKLNEHSDNYIFEIYK
jgi:hypothetical protein